MDQKRKSIDLSNPDSFFNREQSLIEFNSRVLAEAEDNSHPLLERLKFVSILSSNLDEFFMIRVAGLKSQVAAEITELSFDGLSASEQLIQIRKNLLKLFTRQENVLMKHILPDLEKEGIYIHYFESLNTEDKKYLEDYFVKFVLPVLTPLSLDPAHPFPRMVNCRLNIVFALADSNKSDEDLSVAFLQLPPSLERFVSIERKDGIHFVLLETIIKENAQYLFPGWVVKEAKTFRVTRDADIEIAEDEADDLLTEIAEQIKYRKWNKAAVRLEVSSRMSDYLLSILIKSLELEPDDVYIHNRPLSLPDFMQMLKIDKRHLKDIPFQSRIISELRDEDISIFDLMKRKDFMVHHPFDSFSNSVLRLMNEAASDTNVLAIKMTLYRVGSRAPIVEALKRAAENGKSVTAFVELKARFDEESNIIWAKELEHVGVHVVYGVMGLKTHCKIAMVVRREEPGLRTYVHLSTGNYNYTTSKLYTDIGFFTADEDFGMEAIYLFNYLTGYSHHSTWKKFFVAPMNLRRSIIELINRETEFHTSENPGFIFVKMNSLAHPEVINSLYRASQKGVKIKLLVRGICCLKPGVPGLSENIEVRSILGRFLEHSRVFYFKGGGKEEFYLSSADWMTRNLHRRVELMFPVQAKDLQKQLWDLLNIYWKDNTKSWVLQPDGSYLKLTPKENEPPFSAQECLLKDMKKNCKKGKHHAH